MTWYVALHARQTAKHPRPAHTAALQVLRSPRNTHIPSHLNRTRLFDTALQEAYNIPLQRLLRQSPSNISSIILTLHFRNLCISGTYGLAAKSTSALLLVSKFFSYTGCTATYTTDGSDAWKHTASIKHAKRPQSIGIIVQSTATDIVSPHMCTTSCSPLLRVATSCFIQLKLMCSSCQAWLGPSLHSESTTHFCPVIWFTCIITFVHKGCLFRIFPCLLQLGWPYTPSQKPMYSKGAQRARTCWDDAPSAHSGS